MSRLVPKLGETVLPWLSKTMRSIKVLIRTVLVCPLTTNLRRATAKGNVLLDENEADLDEQSVVNVSQTIGIDKTELGEYIGTLSKSRVREIVRGINIIITPSDILSELV